jgi:hypothetical protein
MGRRWIDPNRPDGVQIFIQRVYVAGVHPRSGIDEFLAGSDISLALEREPQNPHDRNAIKVIGILKTAFSTRRFHVGYVPREIAQQIVERGFWGRVGADLRMVECGDYKNVIFDLYGPKGEKNAFFGQDDSRKRKARRRKPKANREKHAESMDGAAWEAVVPPLPGPPPLPPLLAREADPRFDASAIAKVAGSSARSVVAWGDTLLGRVAGEGNTVIHWFLRCLTVVIIACGLLYAVLKVARIL